MKEFDLKTILDNKNSDKYFEIINPSLLFHWSNWDMAVKIMREKKQNNELLLETFYNDTLNKSIYLKNNGKIYKHSISVLYSEYLTNKNTSWWFKEKFKNTSYSFDNTIFNLLLSEMSWFDINEYHQIIKMQLLNDSSIPIRSFRLNTDIQCPVKDQKQTLGMHQITYDGIMFKANVSFLQNKKGFDHIGIPVVNWNFAKPNHEHKRSLLEGINFHEISKHYFYIDFNSIRYETDKHKEHVFFFIKYQDISNNKELSKSYNTILSICESFLLRRQENFIMEKNVA